MRVYYILVCLLLSAFSLQAQNTETQAVDTLPKAPAFTFVEEMPEFPGGEPALLKFLSENVEYPKKEFRKNKQGKVVVRFAVFEDGHVGNVSVIRSVCEAIDNEAMRVIKMLPNFKPGTQQGKPVIVYYNLPVNFKITRN